MWEHPSRRIRDPGNDAPFRVPRLRESAYGCPILATARVGDGSAACAHPAQRNHRIMDPSAQVISFRSLSQKR